MSDSIAISNLKAARIMLEHGLTVEQAQKGIKEIPQAVQGYYDLVAVHKFIDKVKG